jgi:proteasome accessory factor A
VAIAKVLGIETEYGIHTPGVDANPILASSYLVNSYAIALNQQIDWDFEDESPDHDARGTTRPGSLAPIVETHLANTVLVNGARYYVDHAHPEYSSPECLDPRELLAQDLAGEEILRRSMAAAQRLFPEVTASVVYKNNSDGKGNSYGCHENYLMDRRVPFQNVAAGIIPHFLSRSLFSGAGKVGSETKRFKGDKVSFQITQRAEFFEEVLGLETTIKRPLVNTRDEPHADADRYRRLHVIIGDANRSQMATFLKVGTTAIVLCLIEDGIVSPDLFTFADPVETFHQISKDLTLNAPLTMENGKTVRALEIQWTLFELAQQWAKTNGFSVLGDEAIWQEVLHHWYEVLSDLESGPEAVADRVDWAAKYVLMDLFSARHNCGWDDPRLAAMDLQYHDLRPERSLFDRLPMRKLITNEEITNAIAQPPEDTRAWFRGRCLKRWPDSVVSANWDSLVLDVGGDPLRRIPMMDPLKGTKAQLTGILEGCRTPLEVVEALSDGRPVQQGKR